MRRAAMIFSLAVTLAALAPGWAPAQDAPTPAAEPDLKGQIEALSPSERAELLELLRRAEAPATGAPEAAPAAPPQPPLEAPPLEAPPPPLAAPSLVPAPPPPAPSPAAVKRRVRAHVKGGKHDRVAFGTHLEVRPEEEVDSVIAFGGSAVVRSGVHVKEDVVAFGGTVEVEDGVTIGGDVVALGGAVRLGEGVEVRGDAVAMGGQIQAPPSVIIRGSRVGFGGDVSDGEQGALGDVVERLKDEPEPSSGASSGGGGRAAAFFIKIFGLLATGLLGLILFYLAPAGTDRLGRPLTSRPGAALLAGFLGVAAFVPITVVLALSVVGGLLIPVLILGYIVAGFMGSVVIARHLGRLIPVGGAGRPLLDLLKGLGALAALALLATIPYLGWLFCVAACLLHLTGFGAVILAKGGLPPRASDAHMEPAPL